MSLFFSHTRLPNTDFWKGKRVLVTGHTGFKGSWLCLWLKLLGANVWGYALPAESSYCHYIQIENYLSDSQVNKEADISDIESLNNTIKECKPEIVFHLAAQPLVRESYKRPIDTWQTNLMGSLYLLEALKQIKHNCAIVIVTTDKVYSNKEWIYSYRECDRLGGKDPYSASKAALELAIKSWRSSYCEENSKKNSNLLIATARAGNVIGGGDWAKDRIVPDAIRALQNKKPIYIRNPLAKRPWQHVLEPLNGYLILAEELSKNKNDVTDCFNFGPNTNSNKCVSELVDEIIKYWPGEWKIYEDTQPFYEAGLLNLSIEKSQTILGWKPKWDFETSVKKTIEWYEKTTGNKQNVLECSISDITAYSN